MLLIFLFFFSTWYNLSQNMFSQKLRFLRRFNFFDGSVRRDQVTIAVHVVDSSIRRPEFGLTDPVRREDGILLGVRSVPLAGDGRRRVRRSRQEVILLVSGTGFDVRDFLTDSNHRVAKSVQFLLRLGFGRLNHERTGDRPRHGRRVVAVIHQSLRDVFDFNASGVLQRTHVQDELVRTRAVLTLEQNRVVVLQALRHVVGIQDGSFRGNL